MNKTIFILLLNQNHTKGIFTHICATISNSLLIFYLTSKFGYTISGRFTESAYRECFVSLFSLGTYTAAFILLELAVRGIGDFWRTRGENTQNDVATAATHNYAPISQSS